MINKERSVFTFSGVVQNMSMRRKESVVVKKYVHRLEVA